MKRNRRTNRYLIFVIVCGLINGIMAFYSAKKQLELSLSPSESFHYGWRDFMNVIFVTDEFDKYLYIDKYSVMLLLIPFCFFIIGSFLGSKRYIEREMAYYGMLAIRSDSMQKLIGNIHGRNLCPMLCYSFSYVLGIWCVLLSGYPELLREQDRCGSIIGKMLCLGISRTLILMVLLELIFGIMLKKGIALGLFYGVMALVILYLVDMAFGEFNLVLYHDTNYFADSILGSLIVYLLCRWYARRQKVTVI